MKKNIYFTCICLTITILINAMEENLDHKEIVITHALTVENIRKEIITINTLLKKIDEKTSIKILEDKKENEKKEKKDTLAANLWIAYREKKTSMIKSIHENNNISWDVSLYEKTPLTYASFHDIPEIKTLLIVHKQKKLKALYQQTSLTLNFLIKKLIENIKLPKPLCHFIICLALESEVTTTINEITAAEKKRADKITNATPDETYTRFLRKHWKDFKNKCDLGNNFFASL